VHATSSKFLTESTGEKIVKIGQYLAKIWTKYNSLVFLAHPVDGSLLAGTIRYVSSAYLQRKLPEVIAFRSPALTT